MDTLFIFGAKYLFLLAVVILIIVFFRLPKEKRKEMVIFGAISLVLTYVLGLIAGHLWFDPRPFVVGNFTPLIPHAADNGFPSDHTILTAALAMIAWQFNRKASWVVWIAALLVGISRVYVGVHHPIDIAGSIVFAIVGGVITAYLLKLWHSRRNKSVAPSSSSM